MSEYKEYYSINEIEEMIHKNTIYNRIKLLGIKTHKFEMDRHTYVKAADAKRIRLVIERPWMAEQLKQEVQWEYEASPKHKSEQPEEDKPVEELV